LITVTLAKIERPSIVHEDGRDHFSKDVMTHEHDRQDAYKTAIGIGWLVIASLLKV
jgi:hypothetical protein